ncbi:MAG: cation:proton antiporter subunit C [Candidatus Cloacimonadota bacterium]|nr:cation:proton antiporter subunit C [Candidatus Cloacimonadota bacterium]
MLIINFIGLLLIVVGLWAMLTQKNIIKIILGFSIIDTGIHLLIISIGFIKGKTAPILDKAVEMEKAVEKVVDPIPSALVLTAIVIGLAITALMLSYAVQLHKMKKSLDINDFEELKW